MTDLRKLKDKATQLFSKGKFEKSAEAYDEYCKADAKDVQSRLRLGDAWAKAGVKDRAIAAYQWAAEGFAKEGFLPRAIAASKLVLELDPTHKGVQKMLADLYARKGGASKTARPGQAPGKHDSVDLEGTNPPGRKPAAAPTKGPPSPTNRPDAIDLPEYEVPSGDDGSTIGGMSAQGAYSPSNNADAIVIEDGPARPTGPSALTETEIVLDTGAPMSGEVEVPIADLPMGEIVPEAAPEPVAPAPPPAAPAAPPPSYELGAEVPLDEPLDAPVVPLKAPAEVVYSLDEEISSAPEPAPAPRAHQPTPAPPLELVAPRTASSTSGLHPPSAPPLDPTPGRSSSTSGLRPPPAPPLDPEPVRPASSTSGLRPPPAPPLDPEPVRPASSTSGHRPPPAPPLEPEPLRPASSASGLRPAAPPLDPPPARPAAAAVRVEASSDDGGMFVTSPAPTRDQRPPQTNLETRPPAVAPEEPLLLTSRRTATSAEIPAVPSAPDPHRPFSAETAPPGLKPKKPEPSSPTPESRTWVPPAFAASSPSSVSTAPPPAASSDLERSLQIFAEFDVESPAPPLVVAPQSSVARSRDLSPPAASPSGITRAPVAAPPPPAAPLKPPAEALSPAGPSFTELELEGDTLFHEVSAAAARGLRKAGHDAAQVVEEAMEAPEEVRSDGGGLPRIPLFSDLPEDAFIALFERCPLRRKEPGESIIRQGTRGDSFFVICSGSVKVFREEGETRHDLATLNEGTFFGEMALLSDAPRTASVEAASEDTQLLEISAPILKELSEKHATVAIALRKFYRQRLLTNLMNSAPIFKPFGKNDRRTLVEKFKARDVQPGEVLIREGTPSDGLYVVLAGEVVVTVAGQPAAVLKEGDVFGEMSLLTRSPGSATVASVRRTSLLRLPREDFDQIIMSHPQILEMVAELSDARRKANAALQKKSSATESML